MHKPRKRFGQNFLQDQNIIDNIIELVKPKPDDCILEIGPGTGALTVVLSDKVKKLYTVEIDHELSKGLKEKFPEIKVFNTDVLKFNLDQLDCARKIRLVGNLPYNISSPLLFHYLKQCDRIADMHFMLQKELAERIIAKPHNKTYGRLSVMLQSFAEVKKLISIPPSAFYPRPKVDSAIIRIIPTESNNIGFDSYSFLVKTIFSKRRKTIRNNLKTIIAEKSLKDCPFDLSLRAENLSIKDYFNLYKWYKKL